MNKDEIKQAVARGWCYLVNGKKEMDVDLANAISDEIETLFGQIQAKNTQLKEALKVHLHTQKCLEYAAKTARNHGNYYCIAECADSHRKILKDN